MGEEEHATKLLKATEHLGWEAYIYKTPKPRKNKIKEWLASKITYLIEAFLNPDFTFSLQHLMERRNKKPSFIFSTIGAPFVDSKGNITKDGKNILAYDGVIDGELTHNEIKKLQTTKGKSLPYIWGLSTCYATPYIPNVNTLKAAKIFYCGSNWDAKRGSDNYKKIFKILEQTGFLEVYGTQEKWPFLDSALKGPLPYDSISVLEAIQKAGAALTLHSDQHINSKIPTMRIFETIAAGSMPISDKHPFIQEVFGDTVLYIDTSLQPQEVVEQILTHLNWIHTHPEEAAEKIKKAQKIFLERYTSESLLNNIYEVLYKPFKAKKNEKNL